MSYKNPSYIWLVLAFLSVIAVFLNAFSGRYVQYQTFTNQGFVILDTWTGEVHIKTSHGIDLPKGPSVEIPEEPSISLHKQ